MILTCPKCSHSDDVDTKGAEPDECVFICRECNARTAYGAVMPRITVVPKDKMIHVGIDGVSYALDRDYAFTLAKNIMSLKG